MSWKSGIGSGSSASCVISRSVQLYWYSISSIQVQVQVVLLGIRPLEFSLVYSSMAVSLSSSGSCRYATYSDSTAGAIMQSVNRGTYNQQGA